VYIVVISGIWTIAGELSIWYVMLIHEPDAKKGEIPGTLKLRNVYTS
jgi:hypothetical protein